MTSILHEILERSDFSPRTKAKYTLVIDRWLTFAGRNPSEWTRDRVQEWYDSLVASGIKTQSANVYVASLRYVSRWYATRANDPSLDFALVQTRRGRDIEDVAPRALTQQEIIALLGTCANAPIDRRDRTLMVVGLETGMRRMSLEAMTFECISEGAPYPYARVPIKGAGGRGRFDVPLSNLALFVLHDWMAWLREHKHKRGALFVKLRGGSTPDGAMTTTALNNVFMHRAKAAGIDHVHPHLLRHTFVTLRTIAGLSMFDIASITGHKVPGMGAAAHYVDVRAIVDKALSATPPWLDALVREQLDSQ